MKDFWVYGKGSTNARQEPAGDLPSSGCLTCRNRRLLGLMRGYGDCCEGWPGTPSSPGDRGGQVWGGMQNFLMPDSCTGKEVRDELGFGRQELMPNIPRAASRP